MTLRSRGWIFGSDRSSDVILASTHEGTSISRTHYRIDIRWDSGQLFLHDLGSSYGTSVRMPINEAERGEFNLQGNGVVIVDRAEIQVGLIAFELRIPSRQGHWDEMQSNLRLFGSRCKELNNDLNNVNRGTKLTTFGPDPHKVRLPGDDGLIYCRTLRPVTIYRSPVHLTKRGTDAENDSSRCITLSAVALQEASARLLTFKATYMLSRSSKFRKVQKSTR